MIRRLLPCICVTLFCATVSIAQDRDYPKFDFTAGYSLNHISPGNANLNMNGFTGAVGVNFRKWFALEGDMTYTTKSFGPNNVNLFTYLIGPRLTKRITPGGGGSGSKRLHHPGQGTTSTPSKIKYEPFVHALFGGGHLSGLGPSNNGWAGKFGGGLDIVVGKHVAIRAVEVDYYRYRSNVLFMNNALFTFGIRVF